MDWLNRCLFNLYIFNLCTELHDSTQNWCRRHSTRISHSTLHWNHTFHVPTDPLRPWNIPLDSQSVIAVPVTGKYELSALSSSLTVWYAMRETIMYRKPIPVCTKYYMNYLLFELGYIVYLMNVTCLCRERFSCNKTNTLNLFYFCLICISVSLFDFWLQNYIDYFGYTSDTVHNKFS